MAVDPAQPQRRPTGPDESRAIPPRSPVSPDGRTSWPRPSLAARIVVYGGITMAVAGATVGAVLLARSLSGPDGDEDQPDPAPHPARTPAAPPYPAQPAPARTEAAAPRRRPTTGRRHSLRLADFTHAVSDASHFLNVAMAAFSGVAGQARDLHGQYRDLADALHKGDAPPPTGEGAAGPRGPFRPGAAGNPRAPRDDSGSDPRRTHRL